MQTIYKNQPSFNLILDVPPVEQGIRQFWTLTNQPDFNFILDVPPVTQGGRQNWTFTAYLF